MHLLPSRPRATRHSPYSPSLRSASVLLALLTGLLVAACSAGPLSDTSARESDATPGTGAADSSAPLQTPTTRVIPTVTPAIFTPTLEPTVTAAPSETAEPTEEIIEEPTEEPTADVVEEPTDEAVADDIAVLDGDPAWQDAIQTPDGAYVGVVLSTTLNVRVRPSLSARVVEETFESHPVTVYEAVTSEDDGSIWFRIGPKRYVAAHLIAPFVPTAPEETFDGFWVDVNLTDFYAVAYIDATPVYAAIISAGRDERTPLGVFEIQYRVRYDTMDSATVGIPKSDPDYYYLENVEFTQYFKAGGFAIHGNYWIDPEDFGNFTSNGCVGMMNTDAGWFWDFLDVGSTVSIHF